MDRLLIDTDIGVDDAVALLLALRSPELRVEAISTVSGNTSVDQCVRNARVVLELCDCDVPVFRGAERPMSERRRAPRARRPAHGTDGLGDLGLRPKLAGASADRAHERLVELARANPGALTLVTLGPLTSIALALREEPDLLRLLKRTVAMAGAVSGPGTATPRAEFNVWADPDAAQQVFAAALPLTMVPIELSRGPAALGPGDQAQIEAIDTPFARFVAQMCRASANRPGQVAKRRAAGLPDAIAMAVAIDPTLVLKSRRFFVEVETAAGLSEGETVVDLTGRLGRTANAEIIEQIDVQRYKTMLLDACR